MRQTLAGNKFFIALILIALLWGGYAAKNYGEAADDESLDIYARQTLNIYTQLFHKGEIAQPEYTILDNYGPAFVMLIRLTQLAAEKLAPNLSWFSIWHFVSFTGYLIGVISFYSIQLRFFRKSVAISSTLLFATQPVLWGQGFLNVKDSPLMAFTLLCVALGIRMIPNSPMAAWDFRQWQEILQKDFAKVSEQRRVQWRKWLAALALITILLFLLESILSIIFTWLFSIDSKTWLGEQIRTFAPYADSMPVSGYVQRTLGILQLPLWLGLGLIVLVLGIAFVKAMPSTRRAVSSFIQETWKSSWSFWSAPIIWFAALAVGFTTAIRVTGPFAGMLVIVFLLISKGPKSLAILPAFGLLSMLFTYIFWPYLWTNPIGNFMEVIRVMSDFPWAGHVLFDGEVIRATRLPADYLPRLLIIQLTLPTLLLFIAGLVAIARQPRHANTALWVTAIVWLVVPLSYTIFARPTLYHNFRQLLFMTPAIFLLAAFGLNWLREVVNQRLFAALSLVALLPALLALIELHPYEYIYYNELVGGVKGADGKYEMEYWGSSLTHAMEELNQIAPNGAVIGSWGNQAISQRVARPDLQVELLNYNNFNSELDYKYVLIPLRAGRDRTFLDGYPELFVIERLGVSLTIVKELDNFQPDWQP